MRPEILKFRKIIDKVNSISIGDFYNDFKTSYDEIIKIYGYNRPIDTLQATLESDIKWLLIVYSYERSLKNNPRTSEMVWEMAEAIISYARELGVLLSPAFIKTYGELIINNETFYAYMGRQYKQVASTPTWIDLLPIELKNDTNVKAFSKAIDTKLIEPQKNGFALKGSRGNKAKLAYFIGKMYGYEYNQNIYDGNTGKRVPYEAMQNLFNVTRLDRSLKQVYEAKEPQPWRETIDEWFK